jgi:UDPglucose 6-dehydrogenase
MRITIFGSGYVGLVTGACMAEMGNQVLCYDIDEAKIARLNDGDVPIYEPGLDDYIERNVEAGRLEFTTDVEKAVAHGLFQFVAVGTPPDEDGSADLKHVLAVARAIGEQMDDYRIIVDKSTVPVGTADKVKAEIQARLDERNSTLEFDVVSNPEFLKEGAAIGDFMKPDRIVVGTDNPRTSELLRTLYEPFNRSHDRMILMDVRSAELTKYAANAMLATKISFMNELANMAEHFGRIGYHFIYPGAGYGGSCFPKDVRALAKSAAGEGYDAQLLNAVEEVNLRQKHRIFDKMSAHYDGDLAGKTIALWGLSFKPSTFVPTIPKRCKRRNAFTRTRRASNFASRRTRRSRVLTHSSSLPSGRSSEVLISRCSKKSWPMLWFLMAEIFMNRTPSRTSGSIITR